MGDVGEADVRVVAGGAKLQAKLETTALFSLALDDRGESLAIRPY